MKNPQSKFVFLSLHFFLFLLNAAFSQQKSTEITGKVVEESTQEPLHFMNVGLYHANDSNQYHRT